MSKQSVIIWKAMIVFYARDHRQHAPKLQNFNNRPVRHPDVPARTDALARACRQLKLPIHTITTSASVESLATVHDRQYIEYLRLKCSRLPLGEELFDSQYAHDTFTPLTRHTYMAASQSANLALLAAESLLSSSETTYALCRPPGHHAGCNTTAGFCYFNNAALAAEVLAKHGKVAVLDIDYHHGNGTQDIFYQRDDILYVSLHADPSYDFPHTSGYANEHGVGEGAGFTLNFPLQETTTARQYLQTLRVATTNIKIYSPLFVVLSLGFDTYKHDPVAGFKLDEESYYAIGKLIATELPYPTVIIQEGGYNIKKLTELSRQFLTGYLLGSQRERS